MKLVYRSPIYQFLAFLQRNNEIPAGKKTVLDCGAGGSIPPLGLFYEYGFTTYGIDISDDQIALAHAFESNQNMNLNIQKGDMRAIPFLDDHFDFVFELYSIVHLPKDDIRKALFEMYRVLKPNGVCFVSFMSMDCWPMDGKEEKSGEFHCRENGQQVIHSVFSDTEALQYCENWQILYMVKQSLLSPDEISQMTLSEWEKYYSDNEIAVDRQEWLKVYPQRLERWKNVHIFFILRKMKP
ncbi:MAG TPA: SAM-dependent methyltransferase [Anaerolineaceae bacterium]|nr:SAM-dependent methyltransferase [Anaerolineaceae bacterium]